MKEASPEVNNLIELNKQGPVELLKKEERRKKKEVSLNKENFIF